MDAWDILNTISATYREVLGNALVGIYVHGSLAFRCFRWESSDIDFLVVVRHPLSSEQKTDLLRPLLRLDSQCPPKGLEMSVVLEEACRHIRHPVAYELHFSNAHKAACIQNLEDYCARSGGTDPDLAGHFAVTRSVGITLWGKPCGHTFSPVPKEACLASFQNDIASAQQDIVREPVYVILNLCRALAFQREELLLSKEQGGQWGMEHLPAEYRPIVAAAREHYVGKAPFSLAPDACRPFAEYMLREIFGG